MYKRQVGSPGFGVTGHDDKNAEGASIEASGVGYGEGCPLPSRLAGLGSIEGSPSGVRGGVPAAIAFSAYFRLHNASDSKQNMIFLHKKYKDKVVVTVTTTCKSGGDKSPSSHTKLRL